MEILRIIALLIGLISAFNPEAHVWHKGNVIYIENDDVTTAIRFEQIGDAVSIERQPISYIK